LATVIRGADMDRDPLLLPVALFREPDEAGSDETDAASLTEEVQAKDADDASAQPGVDSAIEPPVIEPAAPNPAELLEQIEAQRAQIFDEAYQDGYRAGEEAGRHDAEHAHDEEIGRVRELTAEIRSAFDLYLNDAEEVLVEIAFEAVCKILGQALCEREGVSAMVREVIDQVREREQLIVRLAPQDFAMLNERDGAALHLVGPEERGAGLSAWKVQLVPDERMALGGCLIDSPGGTLDGRLETQLQKLREVLLARRALNADGAG